MSDIISIDSDEQFDVLLKENQSSTIFLLFTAEWSAQSRDTTAIVAELAKLYPKFKFVQIEAERLPNISESFEIVAAPTFLVVKNGKLAGRVDGAKPPELRSIVEKYTKPSGFAAGKPAAADVARPTKDDLNTRLKTLVNSSPVMVFVKGTPTQPRCGFSRQLLEILNEHKAKFSSFNILTDDEVRQGLKEYSNWPTYPQLYINGELVGGLDIVKELSASAELKSMLPKEKDLDERLKEVTTKAPVMLFMKGNPTVPRCGFSRQMATILDEKKIKYEHFDILEDEEVRQGLKTFVSWPTYPMLFYKGELVGGLDIVKELNQNGELSTMLAAEIAS